MRALLWLALLSQTPSRSDDEAPQAHVALALSGGGARGIAHIGVLKALEENGVPVDLIAGTSMGAAIGSLYASGYSADDLARIVKEIDWQSIFDRKPDRALVPLSNRIGETPPVLSLGYDFFRITLPRSALSDYTINRTLGRYLSGPGFDAGRDFGRLPIPFRAVTADLRTGERVVQASGNLPRAVRASMSIPVAFPPVRMGDYLLVDGGIVDNIPIGVACEMGGEIVIAVDATSPPLPPEKYRDLLGVASQLTDILMTVSNRNHLDQANVLIRPDLREHSNTDYSRFEDLIRWGYEAAMAEMPRIREIVTRTRDTPAPVAPTGLPLDKRTLTELRVEGNGNVSADSIRWDSTLRPPEPFRLDRVLRALDHVYASGLFDTCWLDLIPDGDEGVAAVFHVEEAPRGAIDIGLAYNDDDKLKAFLRFKNRNLLKLGERTEVIADASDARNGVRFTLARDRSVSRSRLGLRLDVSLQEQKPKVYQDQTFVNRTEFDRAGVWATALVEVSRPGLLAFTVKLDEVDVVEKPGVGFAEANDSVRALALSFLWDDLDDPNVPRRGSRFSLTHEENLEALGGTAAFRKTSGTAYVTKRVSARSFVDGRLFLGLTEGALPVYEQFRIGGPDLIPGYRRESLWGNQAIAAAVGYQYLVTRKLRLKVTSGAGNTWARREDITLGDLRYGAGLGLLYETPIGPIELDFGVADAGWTRLYFGVGFR